MGVGNEFKSRTNHPVKLQINQEQFKRMLVRILTSA